MWIQQIYHQKERYLIPLLDNFSPELVHQMLWLFQKRPRGRPRYKPISIDRPEVKRPRGRPISSPQVNKKVIHTKILIKVKAELSILRVRRPYIDEISDFHIVWGFCVFMSWLSHIMWHELLRFFNLFLKSEHVLKSSQWILKQTLF